MEKCAVYSTTSTALRIKSINSINRLSRMLRRFYRKNHGFCLNLMKNFVFVSQFIFMLEKYIYRICKRHENVNKKINVNSVETTFEFLIHCSH